MVPEEHSYRVPKWLIYPANQQWEIDETINSTITSSGKGWIALDALALAENTEIWTLAPRLGRGANLIPEGFALQPTLTSQPFCEARWHNSKNIPLDGRFLNPYKFLHSADLTTPAGSASEYRPKCHCIPVYGTAA